MAWSSIPANQHPSFNDIQDAINTGVFQLKPGGTVPPSNNNSSHTRDIILNWISCTIPTLPTGRNLPRKDEITPLATYVTIMGTSTPTTSTPCSFSFTTTYYMASYDSAIVYYNSALTSPVDDDLYINFTNISSQKGIHVTDTDVNTIPNVVGIHKKIYQSPLIGNPDPVASTAIGYNASGGSQLSTAIRLYAIAGRTYRVTATILSSSNTGATWRLEGFRQSLFNPELFGNGAVTATVGNTSSATFVASTCETYMIRNTSITTSSWSGTVSVNFEMLS